MATLEGVAFVIMLILAAARAIAASVGDELDFASVPTSVFLFAWRQ